MALPAFQRGSGRPQGNPDLEKAAIKRRNSVQDTSSSPVRSVTSFIDAHVGQDKNKKNPDIIARRDLELSIQHARLIGWYYYFRTSTALCSLPAEANCNLNNSRRLPSKPSPLRVTPWSRGAANCVEF
ncbi:hypothetical protein IF1G_02704 [Cordyceps javanica]|uniref:Uncharacterized protein n=1 Tax=Cordyceps javanica TaxID=43265 RepID=A0A545VA63_9HYPO|nr:hypothetical protein IF1G_02704 [Cordyceps javanica]